MEKSAWNEDLEILKSNLIKIHPKLKSVANLAEFEILYEKAKSKIRLLDDDKMILIELMKLVSSLLDGHTSLSPPKEGLIDNWLPLRFYCFSDGIFVLSTSKEYSILNGKKILAIDETPIETIFDEIKTLKFGDNEYFAREYASPLLSSTDLLKSIGFTSKNDSARIQYLDESQQIKEMVVSSVKTAFYRYWGIYGEMFGPIDLMEEMITAFDGGSPRSYFDENSERPYYLRYRRPYWYEFEEGNNLVYFQYNSVSNYGNKSFKQTVREMFEFINNNKNEVQKLVIDIRFNSGGNGTLNQPLVHQIIRSDRINQKGKLFLMTAGKSYSAAAMLVGDLLKHTNITLVGRSIGSGLNNYGDGTDITLPNSRIDVSISTVYHQLGWPTNTDNYVPVEFPFEFSSDQYFSGYDPALEAIINGKCISISTIIQEEGPESALQELKIRKEIYGNYNDWKPLTFWEFAALIRQHRNEGKYEVALKVANIANEFYPKNIHLLNYFGSIYEDMEDYENATKYLQKAMNIDPYHNISPSISAQLLKLQDLIQNNNLNTKSST